MDYQRVESHRLQKTGACLQIHVDLNCPHLAEATGGGAIRLIFAKISGQIEIAVV